MKPGDPGYIDERGQRIAYLVAGFIRHTLTEEEHDELDAWIEESDENMQLFEEWTDDDHIQANLEWMDKVNAVNSYKQLEAGGAFKKPTKIWTWSVAASLLLIAAALFVFLTNKKSAGKQESVTEESIPAGSTKATLEYGNNQLIDLGAPNKIIVDSGIVQDPAGMLVYSSNNFSHTQTLRVPIGGVYTVQLSDGTKVWLNSGSKLIYPAKFTDSLRKVQLTGEAYFEVSKNETNPFVVEFPGNCQVKVSGTSFNIKCYANEPTPAITLIEGSITAKRNNELIEILPGEQIKLLANSTERISLEKPAVVTGWIQDLFLFYNSDLESIIRELERWYGVSSVYEYKPPEKFTLSIEKSKPLQEVLNLLQGTGKIKFRLQDKTIYVLKPPSTNPSR